MSSKRIALATVGFDGKSVIGSWDEGDYDDDWRGKRGIECAIENAKASAESSKYWTNYLKQREAYVAVVAFPVALAGPMRVIAKFKIAGVLFPGDNCPHCGEVKS